MTDRELLERAARAAGLILNTYPDEDFFRANHSEQGENWNPKWNPIADDGDALRLAVQLGIEIHPDRQVREVYTAFSVRRPNLIGLNTMEPFGDDEMASTRRAVVRAAAAMADKPNEQAA